MAAKAGVEVLPTLQFYRSGRKLWEHAGALHMEQHVSEGVLFFGNAAPHIGVVPSDYVTDIHGPQDLLDFVGPSASAGGYAADGAADDRVLRVLDVSLTGAAPCIHIFPAVLALARSFTGYASFARLLGDESLAAARLLQSLGVTQVPCFIFYRGGREVGRHVGSSRGDLIGQILAQQSAHGVAPPPSPKAVARQKVQARRATVGVRTWH